MAGTASRRWSAGALALTAALVAAVAAQGSASAIGEQRSGTNHAIVVIDDGLHRTETAISFAGEITGIEALQAAGATAVLSGFGGLGAAVCSIDGLGCSASACLTCQAPKYWHYLRADGGAATLVPSGGGASTSHVGNCDVEAWLWGGAVPSQPAPDVSSICRGAPTTTRPPTTVQTPSPTSSPPPLTPTTATGAPGVGAAPAPPTTNAVGGASTDATTPPPATATTVGDDEVTTSSLDEGTTTSEVAGPEEDTGRGAVESAAAGAPLVDDGAGGGGGPVGLAAVAALVAGIAVWALLLRRRATA